MAKQKDSNVTPAPPDDGYSLLPDGRTRITLDSEDWLIRRPKIGEYRKLRERLWDLQDQKVTITARHRDIAAERAKELKGESEAVQALDVRKRSRDLTAELEELNEQWIRETFDLLGDRPAPEAIDDWPTWLRESDFISTLVEHWRAVPLASGAR